MKEHGLLCTASVALALHEGRQTQVRRPINPQPLKGLEQMFPYPQIHGNICRWCAEKDVDSPCWEYHSVCPVQVGDIFCVRETFSAWEENGNVQYAPDGGAGPWRPSIHMPLKYSRTRKLITSIRVEHGPEISNSDAQAEGFLGSMTGTDFNGMSQIGISPSKYFEKVWKSLYGDDKPWRWVYDLGEIEG